MADFVADFSDDLQTEVEVEAKQLLEEENIERWTLFVDGVSNQRGNDLGIILKLLHGDILPQGINYIFNATNNRAKYEAQS